MDHKKTFQFSIKNYAIMSDEALHDELELVVSRLHKYHEFQVDSLKPVAVLFLMLHFITSEWEKRWPEAVAELRHKLETDNLLKKLKIKRNEYTDYEEL